MSIREVTMYQVWCDWPGCEANTADSHTYAWSERDHAIEIWDDSDGLTNNGKHFCEDHSIMDCRIDRGCDGDDVTHRPCCSSHKKAACCACYRTTHFVEVGPCCSQWKEARDG